MAGPYHQVLGEGCVYPGALTLGGAHCTRPAWIFLGVWFLYQLIEANFGLFNAHANGGGVAFFAHVGGFIFGLLAARLLARAGQTAPRQQWRSTA